MNSRQKCDLINQIRQKIAANNDIDFVIYDCTFEGDCPKDCPKMASELEYLEGELERIQNEGGIINFKDVFTADFEDKTKSDDLLLDVSLNRNAEKLEKVMKNPALSNLPPIYLDSLLD